MRLRKHFLAFHRQNPWVFDHLANNCERLWTAGWRKYSMRTLVAVARFESDLITGGEDVEIEGGEIIRVKLNNNHASYYARLLAYKRRKFESFFDFRRVEGEEPEQVMLFSDVTGEPDRLLGTPPLPSVSRNTSRFFFKRKR